MDLSTSDVWLNCDGDAAACGAKWDGPFTSSMADWNNQPMTVRFDYTDEVRDANFDVNVYIEDEVPGGGGGLLGFAPTYDINGVPCSGACVVYSGIVYVGDDAHSGVYGTANDRLATLSHEMGHIISLAHESTNADETQLYDCGMDDTGPIPHSVMSYNCIDPVAIGGFGESDVKPWDVCGVNHAYNDPAFGFSGRDLTTTTPSPTPTPTPSPDVDGDGVPDGSDNYPNWHNPSQNLPPWPVPSGDPDCDGTTSADETVIGTDPNLSCAFTGAPNDEADDRWPPDFDDNQVINTTDLFQVLPPTFGTSVRPTSPRRDLDPNGVINTTDVFRVLPPFLGSSCTS